MLTLCIFSNSDLWYYKTIFSNTKIFCITIGVLCSNINFCFQTKTPLSYANNYSINLPGIFDETKS